MIPVLTEATASSRPYTDGRPSSAWKHLDVVQERPISPSGERSLLTSKNFIDADDNEDKIILERIFERRERQCSKYVGIALERRELAACLEDHKRCNEAPSVSSPSKLASASLPDLHHSLKLLDQSLQETSTVSNSSNFAPPRLRVYECSSINSTEIMKRLHALGSSASAPSLSPSISNTHRTDDVILSNKRMGPSTAFTRHSDANARASVFSSALDAKKLQNKFSPQNTTLSYGCRVVLELLKGYVLMVDSSDGQVGVQSLEHIQMPQTKGISGLSGCAVFTLLDLADVRSVRSLCYGDSVWLQLSVGPGDVSWEQGGLLGSKVCEVPQLRALGLLDAAFIRKDAQTPATIGYPVPVAAYLPKSRDDKVDQAQSRLRNKSAMVIGKWIIRSALCQQEKKKDVSLPSLILPIQSIHMKGLLPALCYVGMAKNFVHNNDKVYLEQEWFYLGADTDAGKAVLRQLPSAVARKDLKPGSYVVERSGAWKLRMFESKRTRTELSLTQQRMERLLLRAKAQLQQSQHMRASHTKVSDPKSCRGANFAAQLRSQVTASARQAKSCHTERPKDRLKQFEQHMTRRTMNKAPGSKIAAIATSSECSRSNHAVNTSGKSAKRRTGSQHQKSYMRPSLSLDYLETRTLQLDAFNSEGALAASMSKSTPLLLEASGHAVSCALCRSSSGGYNLCCQFHGIMELLEREQLIGVAPATTTRTPRNERVLELLAKEDAAMMELIRINREKEMKRALHADTSARSMLSPMAAYFRDRFKHIGIFVQMYHQQQ